jgi:hypothetical protein
MGSEGEEEGLRFKKLKEAEEGEAEGANTSKSLEVELSNSVTVVDKVK